MKHIADILKNGLNDLGKITKSIDAKTTLLKHLQKNVGPIGSSIKTAYIDKNNVLYIGTIKEETLSRRTNGPNIFL